MDILTPRERFFVACISILATVLGLVVLFNARLDPTQGEPEALEPAGLEAHAHLAAASASAPGQPAPRSYFGGNSAARLARRTAVDSGPAGTVLPGPSPVSVTGRRSTPEVWRPSDVFAPVRFLPSLMPAATSAPDR